MADGPRSLRILVAEDEALIRLDLCEILAEAGYEVVAETGRGDHVLDLAETHRPDLAILDIEMPGLSGLEAAADLAEGPAVPVLVVTAYSQRSLVEQATGVGVMGYLVKPFSRSDLIPAIEMAVARHRDLSDLGAEVGRLRGRLDGRRLLDRAKGVVMDRDGLSEDEAYRHLRNAAMASRRPIESVAADLLAETAPKPSKSDG